MQRYRHAPRLLLVSGLLLASACSIPSRRDNVDAASRLMGGQVALPLQWRLDAKADAEARQRAEAMLEAGLNLRAAIAVAFLASPQLQLALEKLEISRADFVAAATAPNPVLVVGSRQPNGDLASFYPGRTISIGILENIIGLLNIPGHRGIAKHDLERARYEAANSAVNLAAAVTQAWIDYSAALALQDLREREAAIYKISYDNLRARQMNGAEVAADTMEDERRALLSRQADAIKARLETSRARTQLGEQLGIAGWRDDWTMQQPLPELPAADPDPVVEERAAMGRRLDLLAANEAVKARLRVLANQRRFRWLTQFDLGLFRDQATGGTSFTGPNAVIELPLFDQRQSALLNADSQLRTELRQLDASRLTARSEIRTHAAEMTAARQLLQQIQQEIQPGQMQEQAAPVGGDPNDTSRLKLRLEILSTQEETVALLRDYWRARSSLALAAGNWGALSGLP